MFLHFVLDGDNTLEHGDEYAEQNKDHKLNFVEKEAIKMAVRKASTVGDLLETALGLLKKA